MDILLIQVLQQVHHVAVIGDGVGFLGSQLLLSHFQDLIQVVGLRTHPALVVTGHDPGQVHLSNDGNGTCDLRSLALGAAHTAQTGGHEQAAGQVPVLGDTQFGAPRTQQGVKGAMHDALGADVHPASGGHLAVVGNPDGCRTVEVFLVIIHADHQAVADNTAGSQLMAVEQAQRMAGHHNQSLLVRHDLQVLLDQTVLHPVLAHLSGLAVGHQFIGVQRHLEVQVVVDHHLERFALDAVAFIFVDGLAVQLSLWPETVSIDTTVFLQFLGKLLCHLLMMIRMDIAQGVLNGQYLVGLSQMGFTAGGTAVALFKSGIFRQFIVQVNGHALVHVKMCWGHNGSPFFFKYVSARCLVFNPFSRLDILNSNR